MIDEPAGDGFRDMATGLPQLVFGCRASGERTWPSPQWVVFTGLHETESLGLGWLTAIHPDDRPATMEAWTRASAMGDYLVEHRIRRVADGSYRWHQTRAAPLPGAPVMLPNGVVDWVGSSADVDDLYRLRQRTAEAEQHLRTLMEGVPQLIWRSRDMGHWKWASPQWLDFTGQTRDEACGLGWLDAVHPGDREAAMTAWDSARPRDLLDVEFRVRRAADGRYLWHRTRSRPVRNGQGGIVEWLGTTTDVQDLKESHRRQEVLLTQLQDQARVLEGEIRERARIEARLLHAALHDDLTGLRNRTFFMDRLRLALGQQQDKARPCCAVLFLDLDRFKLVNDSLGHEAGDRLLTEVGRRLSACVSSRNTLARFGGDEFALLVGDPDELGDAAALAERIIRAMQQPVWLEQQEVFASFSIGVVQTTTTASTAEAVMRDADIAMYHAKRQGSGGYAVFSDTMRESAVEALELRTDLRNAIPAMNSGCIINRSTTRPPVSSSGSKRWSGGSIPAGA
ncbi:sensor domain-containing diguanylate cyclase [Teichococcus vastitatis]|uniref:Sensor domain-containing diguanylate cyclase n=1 Tax=Teichococcus vastitatis TaxID=2307076 RepID=A0ABS9W8S5_9PROT|nr:sensor domain-containing diguanylate cyclase [Pseudoroseomonas vastitatis]MCI0755699.1 sensor domain-containing diguanylate cyclase [Pseudoroseomonas vastitatis]